MSALEVHGSIVGAEAVVRKFAVTAPEATVLRVRTTVRALGVVLQQRVQLTKLSGQVLHRRTSRLFRSINLRITDQPSGATASVGTAVRYGRYWELGFHGTEQVKAHVRRVSSRSRRGWVLTSYTTVKRTKTAQGIAFVRAFTRVVNQAPRPFLRSALDDLRPTIVDRLNQSIYGRGATS